MGGKKMIFNLFNMVCILGLAGCSTGNFENPEKISVDTPLPTHTQTLTTPPTDLPTMTPVPTNTPTPLPDFGGALVSPADSIDFLMDYNPMDTWIDPEGMHAAIESYYEDGPGIAISIDCASVPYTDALNDRIPYMIEIPADYTFGEESHVYLWNNEGYLYFLEKNCRAEVTVRPQEENHGKLGEVTSKQLYGVAALIEERLQTVSVDNGLQMPPLEIVPGLYEETFYSFDVWRWGEPFRSYSISIDTKKPFIKKTTYGIYDIDMQEFISRRDMYNFPPLGESLLDNLGESADWRKMIAWEGNYELYVWVEDELAAIFPLEKYEQP